MDGDLLKYYCSKKGMTLAELANLVDMNVSTIYRKLSGESDFYRHEIIAIREVLDLSVEETETIFFHQKLA